MIFIQLFIRKGSLRCFRDVAPLAALVMPLLGLGEVDAFIVPKRNAEKMNEENGLGTDCICQSKKKD